MQSKEIHAFDTGAFHKRLYKHILMDEMEISDYSLEQDHTRPNRIIGAVFPDLKTYYEGDITKAISSDKGAEPWEFHARAYLQLITSAGRNEPDDRICTIEVIMGENIPLQGNLRAVIVPHTLWSQHPGAPWLVQLNEQGVKIEPYLFVPGRHPEHYHAQLEAAVRDLYTAWGMFE